MRAGVAGWVAAARRAHRARVGLDLVAERMLSGEHAAFGYPNAGAPVSWAPVVRRGLFHRLINNIGDPWVPTAEPRNVKDMETAVIDQLSVMFGRPTHDHGGWGCVTTGSTDAILHAVMLGRDRLPGAPLIYTEATHYCAPKVAHVLGVPALRIGTDAAGEMDYDHLARVARGRGPLLVFATAGTAFTEAVDQVATIRQVLADRDHYIHLDAALTGPNLALSPPWRHLVAGGREEGGPDSVSFSGHKMWSMPRPSAVLLAHQHDAYRWRQDVPYIASMDTTIDGSRDGQLAVMWWYLLARLGGDGLRAVFDKALGVARFCEDRLGELGLAPHRAPWGMTVMFKEPSEAVVRRFGLARDGAGWARWLAMPNRGRDDVLDLVHALCQAGDAARVA